MKKRLAGEVEPAREALRRGLRDGRIFLHVEDGAYVARAVVPPMAVLLDCS